ncbi:MAG: tRNA uridine-5-carboxymethylaminomethyl(34) synthesis GTPase MnmE, partial [Bacteroidales bacterium]|nr:tRNA uridine-5-carboxymethylaminomethyl(34) synthesis GTPase MnmE [Bacteroidales bacterium]
MSEFTNIENTTICACATGNSSGAIAVIRMSGPQTLEILSKVFKPKKDIDLLTAPGYSLLYGNVMKPDGTPLDDVLVSIFRAPHSYTGEDSAEISCHGSHYIIRELLAALTEAGAKYAQGGDFTKRAFLNGKMDLAQAEAVCDLISSETEAAHAVAMQQMRGGFSKELEAMRTNLLQIVSLLELELDFSDEDVQFADRKELQKLLDDSCSQINSLISSFKLGNAIKSGVPVAIVGATNTGKSTLLNALLREDRAIVSSIAGTTRDTIEDVMNLDGILFRFIDTAGIRATLEAIEKMGIERTYYKIRQASIVLMMLDSTNPDGFQESITSLSKKLNNSEQTLYILLNKCDKCSMLQAADASKFDASALVEQVRVIASAAGLSPAAILPISAKQKVGLDVLESM